MYPYLKRVLPGNGAITSVVSVSTGIQPEFIGKPEPIIMSKSLDILGLEKSEVAMVGDLYDTDIMSGINVGIDTIHVQTGERMKIFNLKKYRRIHLKI